MAQTRTRTDIPTGTRYRVERYIDANFPVGMVFLPDGRLLYNEKTTGNVRLVSAQGVRQIAPVINLPTDSLQERGMLGITIDPNFEDNQRVYVVHTRIGDARNFPANTLVRFVLTDDGKAQDLETLASYPITSGELLHNGGNVHFNGKGELFLSLGDFGFPQNAQIITEPHGKIHRFILTEDGIAPAPDNPFGADNSAYALGLRNPFDFTFDPETGHVWVAEVGPSCDDEINLVLAGFNYGWRENYECVGKGFIPRLTLYMPPVLTFTPVEAPTGILFYQGDAFPEWRGNLFFCNWNFGDLRRVVLDETRTRAEAVYDIDLAGEKCRLDLLEGIDGAVYFGTVGGGDGAVMRIVPSD